MTVFLSVNRMSIMHRPCTDIDLPGMLSGCFDKDIFDNIFNTANAQRSPVPSPGEMAIIKFTRNK